jgi:hypothetical protein
MRVCLQGLLYAIGVIPVYAQWTDSVYVAGPRDAQTLDPKNRAWRNAKRYLIVDYKWITSSEAWPDEREEKQTISLQKEASGLPFDYRLSDFLGYFPVRAFHRMMKTSRNIWMLSRIMLTFVASECPHTTGISIDRNP